MYTGDENGIDPLEAANFKAETPQSPEDAPDVKTEIEPGKILVHLEALELQDGQIISEETWKPLLGGELEPLWEEILQTSDDEVIIKGSTVLHMIYGGYVLDTETGMAPAGQRSDIDVVATTPEMYQKIKDTGYPQRQTIVSTELTVGELEVDTTDLENNRQMNLLALDELETWALALSNQELREHYAGYVEYIKSRILGATPEEFLALDNYFHHESLGVKIKKNDQGNTVASIVDPTHTLDNYMIRRQIYEQQMNHGSYFGFVIEHANTDTVYAKLVEAFLDMEGYEFSNKMPLYAIEAIPKTMRTCCENDIQLLGDPTYYNHHQIMYEVAKRLAQGDEIFRVPGLFDNAAPGEPQNELEWFERKVQENFARSVVSNPQVAVDYMYLYFPLGKFISDEVGDYFKGYHENTPPNTIITTMVLAAGGIENLPPEFDTEGLRAVVAYSKLAAQRYGGEFIQRHSLSGNEPDVKFAESEHYPESMSEIMALTFVAMGWTPELNAEDIRKVVQNWKPKGKLTATWKRKDVEFDKGLDEARIIEIMQEVMQSLTENV